MGDCCNALLSSANKNENMSVVLLLLLFGMQLSK
jgi:hypothetical protein